MDKDSDSSKLHNYQPLQFIRDSQMLQPCIDPGRSSGEPERLQNLVIQFHPQRQDSIEVRQKVDQFWKFIRSDPKLSAFKVTPVQGDEQFKYIQEKMYNMRSRLNYEVKLKSSGISDSDATSKDLRKDEPDCKEGGTSKPTTISRPKDLVNKKITNQNKLSRKTQNKPDTIKKYIKTKPINPKYVKTKANSLDDDFPEFPAIQAMQTFAGKGQLTAALYGN